MIKLEIYMNNLFHEVYALMDKKYQIFISSTYMDLKEIRLIAFTTILEMGHIPVGLDIFKTPDEYTTEKYVSKYIDASQLIVVIIGNRYGSIAESGKSYVEEESIYALSKNKKVLFFVNSQYRKVDNPNYQRFVRNILNNNLVILWNNEIDFRVKLVSNVSQTLTNFPPNTYWIKSSSALDTSDDYLSNLKTLLGSNVDEENVDILGLMLHNLKEIGEFYVLTKEQAKKSFHLSVGMCIAGFVLFAGASILSLVWKENLFALLTALGGVVVEVIAGTSLLVHRKSLEQLNYYYSSLHNNERFLSLINISSKTKCKDELFTKIVESELDRFKISEKE